MAQMALRTKVDRARSYWRGLLAAEGVFWTGGLLLLVFMVVFHVDRWMVLSPEARLGAWGVLGTVFAVGTLLRVIRPLLKPISEELVATLVERRFPQLRERLLTAVEFSNEPDERLAGVSRTLLDDLRSDAEQHTSTLDFRTAFQRQGLYRAGMVFGATLILLAAHVLFLGPAFSAYLSRMALNNTPVWRDTRVQVAPLRTKVLKGSDFTLAIEQNGRRMKKGQLHFRFGEGRWNRVDLAATANGGFEHRFTQVTESLAYYATAGDGISDRGFAQVVDPAAVMGARLTLEYPAYMDRPAITVNAESGGVAAPVGTHVKLELKSSKPLELAEATIPPPNGADKKVRSWNVSGTRIDGALTVKGNGQYSLRLKDQDGFFTPEAQVFPIKAIPDQTPEVQLLEPNADLDVVPDAQVHLSITAKDDYGIHEVRVPYQVEDGKPGVVPAGVGGPKTKTLELENAWELAGMHLKPGDSVKYHVEATDYDNISGPHVGKSGELQLHVIDRTEAERRYEEQRNEILQQMAELIKEQKAARADVEAQRNAAKPNAEAVAAAEERQRAAANTTADLGRRVAELNRMAETNRLADKTELDSQKSAREGLNKLSREAMPQAANRIGGAQMQANSNPQGAKSELGQASQQQQQIVEDLNRVAQQLKPGSELGRLAQRFEKLAQEQRAIQAQTEKLMSQTLGKSMNELTPQQRAQLQQNAQAQQNLQRNTSQAMQDLQRTAKSLQSRNGEQAQAAQDTSQSLQQGQVTEQQNQAAQSTQQNSLGQAKSQQENAAQQLENAAQQLRSAMNPNDPKALERQLRQAQSQLNRMMEQHRDAMQQTRSNMTPQQRQELARQQQALQKQAQALARQLERLQRRAPSAGKASQAMQQAQSNLGQSSQSLSQGQQQSAESQQQQAMEAMQRAMQSLQQAMAEAKKDDDPFAELRKQLNRLAAQQKAIQQSTQHIDEQQQAKGPAAEDAEALKRLNQQQSDLEAATRKLEPELPGDVFRSFSQQARRAMGRSQEGLAQANPKVNPTQQAQRRALAILEQLSKALDHDPNDTEKGQQGGGGGQQGGSGGSDPELLKRIAEIRLLRTMEREVKAQTQDVDDSRGRNPLTDAQKSQVDETSKQQTSARSLAEKVAQGLSKYRSLAGKVSQAGKHMSEAQRGLDQQDTGDGVQEQEEQAIIRLSEALRQAQSQAQSQSRQQQRRQQQQQQQQQQASQPSGGTPQQGQQQQGGQPAMRSLQRRAGREDGATHGFNPDAKGFAGLDPREQDALRQSYKEKSPAEYQDLINRYYRALSQKAH